MSDNPKLRKNGGKGTKMGNLLRGLVDVGKVISPQLKSLIDNVAGVNDFGSIESQLAKEGFDENELKFLLAELDKDKQELIEITKRWISDNESGSWLARNVRPASLALYNVGIFSLIIMDSWISGFAVDPQWITILLTNSGLINTAYFGSRYLEKRDTKKFK
jgi:hypothetical protein